MITPFAVQLAEDNLVECGCCGQYHPRGFSGDCRDDLNRFGAPEELAALWAAAPALRRTVALLAAQAAFINGAQHAGRPISAAAWSELYRRTNDANALLLTIREG